MCLKLKAGSLSAECFNSIRTVQAFGIENLMSTKYDEKLLKPFQLGKKEALSQAFTSGAVSVFLKIDFSSFHSEFMHWQQESEVNG